MSFTRSVMIARKDDGKHIKREVYHGQKMIDCPFFL